jgi:hypothetical protein
MRQTFIIRSLIYYSYLYGGAGFAPNETGYDDVYILSMPSFTWIKWYPTSDGPGRPHHSLTCNVIDGAQMLVIGGTFPNDTDCDSPLVYGSHNLDLGKQNSDNAQWHAFQPNITSYVVPPEIISKVGGNSKGGATATAPATWGNQDLPVYFTRQATVVARTATRAIPKETGSGDGSSGRKISTGAIAGIAVAGAAVVVLLAIGCFCIRRHRRNQKKTLPAPEYQTSEYNNQYNPVHPQSPQYHVPAQRIYTPQSPVELSGHQSPRFQHISVEPKYDSVPNVIRQGPIQHEQHQAAYETGGWHSHSPHPSQQYYTPTASPHPSTMSPPSAQPSELADSRVPYENQASPAPTYTSIGRKAVSPGGNL